MLKNLGGGLQHFSVSPRPLGSLNLLGLTNLELGLGGLGTKVFGPGLDNFVPFWLTCNKTFLIIHSGLTF